MLRRRCSKSRDGELGGFTLIELLVVMSIMSMLMSILLPALSNAREQGKRVQCLSRLRQLTMAWNFYAMDNDDKLCSPDTYWNNPGNNWVADGPDIPGNDTGNTEKAIKDGGLWLYTSYVELYKCKSDSTDLLRSYSLSNTMGGYDCGCGNMTTPFKNLAEISRASERMVFIDAESSSRWITNGFWPVSDIDPKTAKWAIPNHNRITARHNDGCNLSFADFHCEHYKWKDSRTVKLANLEISAKEASDNNPDLERMINLLKGPRD